MKSLFLIVFLFYSVELEAKWYQQSFDVMGTRAKVEFESDSPELAEQLLKQVVFEMNRVDQLMSPYKPASELSILNQTAAKGYVKISKELFNLLVKSESYSKLTQGAFDVTFSSVGYLYDYRKQSKPDAKTIKALKSSINYQSIQLKAETSEVKFVDENTKIDLGGIAKGHAVDQCIELLKRHGIKNAFVSAGGDSRVIGSKGDRLWYIGIRHPRDAEKLIVNMPLQEVAISTSGDYERFFEQNGIRYHHIIDPNTGDSARSSQSVTILADTSVDADALSTSIFILGPEKGMAMINQLPNVSAVIIDKNGKMTFSNDLTGSN